jgi:hypothetical protein
MTGNSIYTLQNILEKRKNLIAIKKISKNTRILFKETIVIINKSIGSKWFRIFIYKQVKTLSEN